MGLERARSELSCQNHRNRSRQGRSSLSAVETRRTSEPEKISVGAVRALAANEGAELIRRCRAGDGAAWEEVVQSYSRRIYNLAYRFTSRADAAEDLTQEVFIRVYLSLDHNNPKQFD